MHASVPGSRYFVRRVLLISIGCLLTASMLFAPILLTASVELICNRDLSCIQIGPQISLFSGVQIIGFMLGGSLPGVHTDATHHVIQHIFPAPVLILLPALLPLIAVAFSMCMLVSKRGLQWLTGLWRVVALLGIVVEGVDTVVVILATQGVSASVLPVGLAGALTAVAYTTLLFGVFTTPTLSPGSSSPSQQVPV